MYYKCLKINPNCSESYIGYPDWIKNKNAAINYINKKDNKCFHYAVTVALNHEEIKKDPQRITKIKPFINKCNWKRIGFQLEKNNWKKFEKINVRIALNVLYAKKGKYILLMFQKIIQIGKKQVIFNGSKWRKTALSWTKRIIDIIKRNNKE